jgi:hypothetical protein
LVESSLRLPDTIPKDYTEVSSSDYTVEVICQHLFFLINDYPEFFLRLVDEWIVFERENEQAKLLEDSRYGTTYQSRSRLQRELHPRIRFEHMVKKALREATNAIKDLPIEERRWYLYTDAGQRKAQSRWEVQHVAVASDDESDGRSSFSSHVDTQRNSIGETSVHRRPRRKDRKLQCQRLPLRPNDLVM